MCAADGVSIRRSASEFWIELAAELTSVNPTPPAEIPAVACACSSSPRRSLTRFSTFRNLSMTLSTLISASCGAGVSDAAALLLRRSAHRGGRSVGGKTQAIFALRQLEHGDCLSHLTLRDRHVLQLRNFCAGLDVDNGVILDVG